LLFALFVTNLHLWHFTCKFFLMIMSDLLEKLILHSTFTEVKLKQDQITPSLHF
jgi:hypothetical protein